MRPIDADKAVNKLCALFDSLSWHSKSAVGRAIDIIAGIPTIALAETPSNAPLTLEELREMTGEPVWVEYVGIGPRLSGLWTIIHGEMLRGYETGTDNPVNFTIRPEGAYGSGWLAYRQKPEEGTA